jgi:hypothetical protein
MAQNYSNHRRWVPMYHFVAGPIFLVNLGWNIYHVIKIQSADTIISALVAFALVVLFLYSRLFANKVQDRVIRLEERLRMANVLPVDLRPRIGEFTPDQLIALRFASDGELPALARKVLDEKIANRETIKKLITNWRADELRA